MIKKDEKKISSSFEENIAYMDQVLPVKERVFFILLTDL